MSIIVDKIKKYFKYSDSVFVGFRDGFSFGNLVGFDEDGFYLTQINNAKPKHYSWNHFEVIVNDGVKIYKEKRIPTEAKIILLPKEIHKLISTKNESEGLKLISEIKKLSKHYQKFLTIPKDVLSSEKEYKPPIEKNKERKDAVLLDKNFDFFQRFSYGIDDIKLFINWEIYVKACCCYDSVDRNGNAVQLTKVEIEDDKFLVHSIMQDFHCQSRNAFTDSGKWNYAPVEISKKDIEKIKNDKFDFKKVSGEPKFSFFAGDPWNLEGFNIIDYYTFSSKCGAIAVRNPEGDLFACKQ